MKNSQKTLCLTAILSALAVITSSIIEVKSKDNRLNCSYLNPILIDFLAFGAGLFLIFDGIYRILEHKDASLKKQFTRSVRIALGCTLVTIHLIQFLNK
jgi:hypothetical protein